MEVSKEKMKRKIRDFKKFCKGSENATHVNIRRNQNTNVKMTNSLSQQQGNVFFTIYT